MRALWQKWTATVPAPFLAALLLGGGYLLFIGWDQSHWWSTKEDYGFGWLVPIFVAFVLRERWPLIRERLGVCGAEGSPRAAGASRLLLNTVVYGAVTGGGLLFLLGAFYRAGAGPSHPGSFALSLGAACLLLPMLFLNAPATNMARPSGIFGDARVRLVGLFLFPCLVWLVSAPMVSIVENNLSLFLLRKVTSVVFFVFDMLGLAIEQQGNVLLLPSGRVGVEDACSGIRSLTACLFAGSFLAAVFLDKLWQKIALVVAAMCFAFFTNLLRSLFLTSWAYNYGSEAIEGSVHDVAGYSVLGLTVVGLLCLLPLFRLEFSFGDSEHEDEAETGA